jgi:hypothetical protein
MGIDAAQVKQASAQAEAEKLQQMRGDERLSYLKKQAILQQSRDAKANAYKKNYALYQEQLKRDPNSSTSRALGAKLSQDKEKALEFEFSQYLKAIPNITKMARGYKPPQMEQWLQSPEGQAARVRVEEAFPPVGPPPAQFTLPPGWTVVEKPRQAPAP